MQATTLLNKARVALPVIARRNIGITAPALQKASDPIQQLFLDKVREYKQKSRSGLTLVLKHGVLVSSTMSGGKLVDPTPEIQKEKQSELDRVAKQYGGGAGIDMTKFPDVKFPEVSVSAS